MKILLSVLLVIIVLMLSSCGFFRSIGLYNVPPNYSETYEEITGKKFIDHQNKKDNLRLTLVSLKKEYSPYEEIELKLIVENISNADTMYLYETGLYPSTFPYRELIVTDSLNKKIKVLEDIAHVSRTAMVDNYGRIITPTVAPNNSRIAPKDSLIKVLSFRTGKRICDDIECRFTFKRENVPGNYQTYYIQYHEEYDEMKGPISEKINSSVTNYKILNYTSEELEIRNKVKEIIYEVYRGKDSLFVDSLYSSFLSNYSDNIYVTQLKEFLELYSSLRKNKKN